MFYLRILEAQDEEAEPHPVFASNDQALIAEVGAVLARRLGVVPGVREVTRRQSARPLKVSGPNGDSA